MIKSSSIFFIYTPEPEFRNAKRPVWNYPPQILSTQICFFVSELIPCAHIIRVSTSSVCPHSSEYPHHPCAHIIRVPTSSVYRHHLSSAMRAFPSYVVRSSRVYLYVLLAKDEDSSKWLDSTSKMPHISS